MTRIEAHIEKLLLSHDCVIVPGIGGFITRYESSFVEEDEIYPPYRSVSFNSQLKDNDGLLVQSYMTAYDTSYPRAQSLVEENIKEISNALHEKGEYEFAHIGKLQLMQNQSLVFSPFDDLGLFSRDHYGLAPCAIEEQAAEATSPVAEVAEHHVDIEENHVATIAEAPKRSLGEEQDDSHYVIRISKRSVRYAVATVAAALLYFVFTIAPSANPISANVQEAAFVSTTRTNTTGDRVRVTASGHNGVKQQKPAKRQEPAKRKTPKQQEVARPKEASKQKMESPKQRMETPRQEQEALRQKMEAPKKKTETMPRDDVKYANNSGKYTIVVASAISRDGGHKLVENLKKEHFDNARFVSYGKMNRVVYASYPTQKEASEALRKLRASSDRFSSAWVMKQ
jgi:hypothetical protein